MSLKIKKRYKIDSDSFSLFFVALFLYVFFYSFFFFFNDTATTEIYTLSLHDALPIDVLPGDPFHQADTAFAHSLQDAGGHVRSEEHTSELQSRFDLVCRLLLANKKTKQSRARPDKPDHQARVRSHYGERA